MTRNQTSTPDDVINRLLDMYSPLRRYELSPNLGDGLMAQAAALG
jgi:hypothetical protein